MLTRFYALPVLAARTFIICLMVFFMPGEVLAAARELDQSELRQASAAGNTISLKRAIDSISAQIGGKAVDARAFEAGDVFYRIVVKKPNGKIVSVIVNARTGASVAGNSSVGRQISAAAKSSVGRNKKSKA